MNNKSLESINTSLTILLLPEEETINEHFADENEDFVSIKTAMITGTGKTYIVVYGEKKHTLEEPLYPQSIIFDGETFHLYENTTNSELTTRDKLITIANAYVVKGTELQIINKFSNFYLISEMLFLLNQHLYTL